MLEKLILIAAGLVIAAPVLADGRHKHSGYKKPPYHSHYHYRHHARPVPVRPAPRVHYAPPPWVIYYAPPPAQVYYAPPPVYRAPAPTSGISIRLHFPL